MKIGTIFFLLLTINNFAMNYEEKSETASDSKKSINDSISAFNVIEAAEEIFEKTINFDNDAKISKITIEHLKKQNNLKAIQQEAEYWLENKNYDDDNKETIEELIKCNDLKEALSLLENIAYNNEPSFLSKIAYNLTAPGFNYCNPKQKVQSKAQTVIKMIKAANSDSIKDFKEKLKELAKEKLSLKEKLSIDQKKILKAIINNNDPNNLLYTIKTIQSFLIDFKETNFNDNSSNFIKYYEDTMHHRNSFNLIPFPYAFIATLTTVIITAVWAFIIIQTDIDTLSKNLKKYPEALEIFELQQINLSYIL